MSSRALEGRARPGAVLAGQTHLSGAKAQAGDRCPTLVTEAPRSPGPLSAFPRLASSRHAGEPLAVSSS